MKRMTVFRLLDLSSPAVFYSNPIRIDLWHVFSDITEPIGFSESCFGAIDINNMSVALVEYVVFVVVVVMAYLRPPDSTVPFDCGQSNFLNAYKGTVFELIQPFLFDHCDKKILFQNV